MPDWDTLYARSATVPQEPEGWVAQTTGVLRERGVARALDLGCGGGRHAAWLERVGVEAWGVDASPHGLALGRRLLADGGLPARLALADMRELPFPDDSFDAVVSIHVIYHSTSGGLGQALSEVRRVLRPGGTFLVTLLSTRTWKYGEGEQVEADTFVQARGPEAGVPHHYVDEPAARAILVDAAGLAIEALDHEERHDEDGTLHAHWNVIARRPAA